MTTDLRAHLATTLTEIDRDHRLVALALLRQLAALSTEQLTAAVARGRLDDPDQLWRRIEDLLADSRSSYRRLNDARLTRRGRYSADPPHPRPPRHLRRFARHGAYAGAYDDLRALARAALGDLRLPDHLLVHLDLDALALDLHLRGALWTLDRAGKIHAFRPPADHPAAPAHHPPLGAPRRRRQRRPRPR